MDTIQFRSADHRGLVETLAEVVKLADAGKRPAIDVNGVIFGPGDLSGIAGLMPEGPLTRRHQAIVDELVKRPKPTSYRRAARSLARRAGASG